MYKPTIYMCLYDIEISCIYILIYTSDICLNLTFNIINTGEILHKNKYVSKNLPKKPISFNCFTYHITLETFHQSYNTRNFSTNYITQGTILGETKCLFEISSKWMPST